MRVAVVSILLMLSLALGALEIYAARHIPDLSASGTMQQLNVEEPWFPVD